MATLAIDSIDLYYGAAQALRGVSLTRETGKVTCVLGRNGVGKSLAAARHHGRAARRAAARITWKGEDSAHWRPMTAPGAASPMCRRAARSSRC